MFLGHFGTGLAAKAAAPRVSLGTLFLAAQLVDLLWPTLLLVGLESVAIDPRATRVTPLDFVSYPISHSLLAVGLWATAFAALHWLARRSRRGALVVASLVVSHWLLDFVVHRPDLPLAPGDGSRLGLGLWESLPATLFVELALFAVGLGIYLRRTRASDRTGSFALWGLVVFLLGVYAGSVFGLPPPSVTAIAWAGQAQWLIVAWGYWIDRHRVALAAG